MLVVRLFIMGLSTCCIGLLPTYASIGVLAPILLIALRIIQGIGLGGEWGGASLMVLEHAPADKRGFYTSFVQIGFPIGLVLATLVFSLVTKRSEEHTSELQSHLNLVCRLLLEKKNNEN